MNKTQYLVDKINQDEIVKGEKAINEQNQSAACSIPNNNQDMAKQFSSKISLYTTNTNTNSTINAQKKKMTVINNVPSVKSITKSLHAAQSLPNIGHADQVKALEAFVQFLKDQSKLNFVYLSSLLIIRNQEASKPKE